INFNTPNSFWYSPSKTSFGRALSAETCSWLSAFQAEYQRTLMVQLADTKNKELAHLIQLLKHKKITPLAFQQGAYFYKLYSTFIYSIEGITFNYIYITSTIFDIF